MERLLQYGGKGREPRKGKWRKPETSEWTEWTGREVDNGGLTGEREREREREKVGWSMRGREEDKMDWIGHERLWIDGVDMVHPRFN